MHPEGAEPVGCVLNLQRLDARLHRLSELLADLSTERFEAEGIEQRLATVVIAAPLVVRGGGSLATRQVSRVRPRRWFGVEILVRGADRGSNWGLRAARGALRDTRVTAKGLVDALAHAF